MFCLYSVHVSGSHLPIIRSITVSMRHLVYVTLCRWLSGMQEHMLLHTRRSSRQSDINQVAFIQQFSWWWAHGCRKHIENRNKHILKIMYQVGYLQGTYLDARSTKHKEHSIFLFKKSTGYFCLFFFKLYIWNSSHRPECTHYCFRLIGLAI